MANPLLQIQQFMALIENGPPSPDFLAKALNKALVSFALDASQKLGPPPGYLAAMAASGYDDATARHLWRYVLQCALERPGDVPILLATHAEG